MTEQDFCYWIQGYFEISGCQSEVSSLSTEQLECIMKHIRLVQSLKKDSMLMFSISCWVQEALTTDDNSRFIRRMKEIIDMQFLHVIDPKHPNQVLANQIHNYDPPKIRC